MRMQIICNVCTDGMAGEFLAESWYVPLRASGFYRETCPAGHVNLIILQQMRFEVLAETAVQAILDGYTREAVSSFAASLERFYEFYVQAVLLTRGVEGQALLGAWGDVKNHSERQMGMFAGLFLIEEKQPAPLLPQQAKNAGSVSFRNKVIHQGHIPTEDEAIQFGQRVIEIVEGVLELMQPRYELAMDSIVRHHQAVARAEASETEQSSIAFTYHPMVYRLAPVGDQRTNLSAMVAERRGRLRRKWVPASNVRHG